MSDAGSAHSIEAKRLQLNLKVLQRHDPSIVEILDSTSYVVLYKYVPAPAPSDADSQDSPADMQWVKTSVEGSMFIFRRSQPPLYGFFILNRHGVENFSHYLEDEANLELTPEYIIVQSGDDQIKGIWIFEEDHRDRLGQKMLELSRLSKHGTNLSRAVASVPAHGSNNSPSSISPSMALPAGQSISLDMLFGPSTSNGNSVPQNTSHGNQADMWDTQQQPISIGTATNAQQQGISLLDSLFADMSGSGRAPGNTASAHPSPDRANTLQAKTANTTSADEDALRSLLGLGSTSPMPKSSPGPHQAQIQQKQSPHNNSYSPSSQQHPLSTSQRPPPHQQYQQQTVLEPLAPRPQKLAQFDSVTYEPPVSQQIQSSPSVQKQPMQYQAHPPAQPPPPHMLMHQNQHYQQYQQPQQQRQPPAQPSQQQFHSAPLMPSVLLNKNKTSQPSPSDQQRTLPSHPQPQQPQQQQPPTYGGQQQHAQHSPSANVPQYSPTSQTFSKYGPPPVLRVKSPLRQSQTFSYASSDFSNSEARLGALSIPPPPVPPVESRPANQQPQPQQGQQRRSSGDIVPQAQGLSHRSSPRQGQAFTAAHALEGLTETLKNTSLYQHNANSNYSQPIPVDRETFKRHLYTCFQDPHFMEALYNNYLDQLAGK